MCARLGHFFSWLTTVYSSEVLHTLTLTLNLPLGYSLSRLVHYWTLFVFFCHSFRDIQYAQMRSLWGRSSSCRACPAVHRDQFWGVKQRVRQGANLRNTRHGKLYIVHPQNGTGVQTASTCFSFRATRPSDLTQCCFTSHALLLQ